MRRIIAAAVLVLLGAPQPQAQTAPEVETREDNWPRFRGSDGNAIADHAELPTVWSRTENVAWATEIPGRGWSSPIVWGSSVFVTSAIEPEGTSRNFSGFFVDDMPREDMQHPEDFKGSVRFMVYAIDTETGHILWEREAHRGTPSMIFHAKNSLATETPATDGERVYAYFGTVGVFAYRVADGQLLWKYDVAPRKLYYDVGPASCPIVVDGRVLLLDDNDESSSLTALDPETGKKLWRARREPAHPETGSSWMTPLIWRSSARAEIITAAPNRITSYTLDGTELWNLATPSRDVVASPVSSGDVAFVPVGSPWENDRPLYAISAGASGDISSDENAADEGSILWQQRLGASFIPSPLAYRDNVYVVSGRGILTVYDARTGERQYRARVGDGSGFSSSPWASRGRVYLLSEEGDTYILTAGNEYELIAKNGLDEHTQANAAIAHDSLFIRTATKLYRIHE